jgi:kumamolisin
VLRRPLALALSAAAVVAAGAAVAPPAQAEGARVVLTLRAASDADLAAAALRPPTDAADRAARTAALTPPHGAAVRRWLGAHGFTVEQSTAWTITARGPAHLLARRLPRALRPAVLSVTRDAAGSMRPRAVPVGFDPAQLRAAYQVAGTTADGRGTTLASIQFSGWDETDAQVFARGAGIALSRGQITTVEVAGARGDVADGAGGAFEVALDVQAALGAAPAARQRVYVAPNTTSGAIAVYDAVATAAEVLGLTAVSISWGACEQATSPQLVQALEQSLARMVAAGTTVFAASGDAGAYGCAAPGVPDLRLAVDYPAASPSVLAVGGTSLRFDGRDWVESAWSDRSTAGPGYAGVGTGGGLSTLFDRPVWQAGSGPRAVPDVAAVADPRTGIGVYGPDASGRRGWLVGGGTSGSAPLLAGQLASTASGLGRSLGFGRLHVPLYAAARDGVGLRDVVEGDNLRHRAARGYDLATGLGSPLWSSLGPRLLVPALVAPAAMSSGDVAVTPYAPVSRTATYGLAETVEAACAQGAARPPTRLVLDGADRATAAVLAVVEDGQCRTTSTPVVLDRAAPASSASLSRTSRPGVLALSWGGLDPAPSSGLRTVTWRLRRTDSGQVVASGSSARSAGALRPVARGVEHQLEVEAVDALGARSGVTYSPPLTA